MKTRILGILLAILMVVTVFALSGCEFDLSKYVCIHEWSDWNIVEQGDCETPGLIRRECEKCGATDEEKTLPTGKHIYEDRNCIYCGLTSVECFNFTYLQESDSYSIKAKSKNDLPSAISLPSFYNNKPVTTIDDYAFEDCIELTSVVIPNSVTTIGDYAFYDCSSLASIVIPNSVTLIGHGILFGTAYSNDKSNWEDDVLYVNNHLIGAIHTISGEYVIKNGTISIAKNVFALCGLLESIYIPESVISIYEGTFAQHMSDGLANITVAENNQHYKSIDGNLYSKDGRTLVQYAVGKKDTSFKIPDYVTTIGYGAFALCYNLTEVIIPNSVITIDKFAFSGSPNLTKITIPDNVNFIGEGAFNNCHNLTITVGDKNQYYKSIDGNLYTQDGKTLIQYSISKKDTLFEIPNSVITIGYSAFSQCYGLINVVIPDSVTTIGQSAFSSCSSLTSVVIPDSVTSIGVYAFSNCDSLQSVVIGDSVTTIGESAFSSCSSLANVVIPDSVTTIGESAFIGCSSLASVIIPDSVTSIGERAFLGCSSLTDVYYTGTEEEWAKIVIDSGNSPLTNATIHYNYVPEE